MRSQQVILVALAVTLLSLATVVNGEKNGNASTRSWKPFRTHLHLGTRLSAGLPPAAAADTTSSRALLQSASYLKNSCPNVCGAYDTVYYGECGAFTTKNEDSWCDVAGSEFCCATSEEGCCPTDGGAVAGLVIGIIVFLALSITACAWCCKCCCFKPPPAPTVVMSTIPMGQVQMQPQMQVQQQVVQQQV